MYMSNLDDIVEAIEELSEDRRVPRNIRAVIKDSLETLKSKDESDIVKLSTAISMLDEACNDPNIAPFTRTEIWNIVSTLESIQSELE